MLARVTADGPIVSSALTCSRREGHQDNVKRVYRLYREEPTRCA
jgi:hypothetical protein